MPLGWPVLEVQRASRRDPYDCGIRRPLFAPDEGARGVITPMPVRSRVGTGATGDAVDAPLAGTGQAGLRIVGIVAAGGVVPDEKLALEKDEDIRVPVDSLVDALGVYRPEPEDGGIRVRQTSDQYEESLALPGLAALGALRGGEPNWQEEDPEKHHGQRHHRQPPVSLDCKHGNHLELLSRVAIAVAARTPDAPRVEHHLRCGR